MSDDPLESVYKRLDNEEPDTNTEDGVALEFSRRHTDGLRWVQEWNRWLRWDGTRWAADRTVHAMDLVRKLCRELAGDDDKRQKSMRQAAFIASVERLARSDRRHAATPEQFDAGPFLINTPGGIVDLVSGTVGNHEPDRMLTKITNASPGDAAPTWSRFLDRITAGDHDLQMFLARVCGYCLTGDVREHALFFLYGTGANGKSTFIDSITHALGDYVAVAGMDTFTATKGERHPADLAALRGARLVTANETESGRRWDEARIKALTGGDKISARFMRGDFFTFTPTFKLIIAGNHKPQLRSVDEALRRRLHLVPFTAFIPPEERDPELAAKLRAESDGILRWAMDGCRQWQNEGLNPPAAVVEATAAYIETQDSLAAWIEDCCETGPNAWELPSLLFASWKEWADKAGEFVGTQRVFGDRLEATGYARHRANGVRQHRGIALRTTGQNVRTGPWGS